MIQIFNNGDVKMCSNNEKNLIILSEKNIERAILVTFKYIPNMILNHINSNINIETECISNNRGINIIKYNVFQFTTESFSSYAKRYTIRIKSPKNDNIRIIAQWEINDTSGEICNTTWENGEWNIYLLRTLQEFEQVSNKLEEDKIFENNKVKKDLKGSFEKLFINQKDN